MTAAHDGRRSAILAIDTATTRVVIATGSPSGVADGISTWPAGYRHGETLLPSIGRFLGEQNIRRSRLVGIAVGTGPGAFTGLRVGIATAKGMAHGLGIPLIGVSTGEALLAASGAVRPVLLLPAGPTDRLVVRPGRRPVALPAGEEPEIEHGETLIALDLEDRAPSEALERGEAASPGARARVDPARGGTPQRRRAARARDARPGLRHAPARCPRGRRDRRVVARPPVRIVDRADAARGPAGRPRDRGGELHGALAAARLPQRARVEPDGPIPRGAPGDVVAAYGGMWLMVDEAHITTFAVHPAGAASGSVSGCSSPSSTWPSTKAPARRPSRCGCRTWPRDGSTRSTASGRSGCGRAITATTTRTR